MIYLLLKACINCIRSLLGPPGCCRFEMPCTDYAIMQLNEQTLLKAIPAILKRLLTCNPLSR